MSSPCIREASEACFHGCSPFLGSTSQESSSPRTPASAFRFDFAVSAASSLHHPDATFTNHESLPSLHDSFSSFVGAFPQFVETEHADSIRDREYRHLSSTEHVCLDYSTGHGLFSFSQLGPAGSDPSSSSHPLRESAPTTSFDISYKPVNLGAHLAHGSLESELESRTRARITKFMNLSEDDYTMVFASNQSSAFRIVADSYPFQVHRRLLSVYDHENEAVESMIESSKKKGARVKSAEFSWPGLSILSEKLKNMVLGNDATSVGSVDQFNV